MILRLSTATLKKSSEVADLQVKKEPELIHFQLSPSWVWTSTACLIMSSDYFSFVAFYGSCCCLVQFSVQTHSTSFLFSLYTTCTLLPSAPPLSDFVPQTKHISHLRDLWDQAFPRTLQLNMDITPMELCREKGLQSINGNCISWYQKMYPQHAETIFG